MPTILTKIIEGPRQEDGKVRYWCPTCQIPSSWHTPPDSPTAKVIHECRVMPKPASEEAKGQQAPCVESMLASVAATLRLAENKAVNPELKAALADHIASLKSTVRLAVFETVQNGK